MVSHGVIVQMWARERLESITPSHSFESWAAGSEAGQLPRGGGTQTSRTEQAKTRAKPLTHSSSSAAIAPLLIKRAAGLMHGLVSVRVIDRCCIAEGLVPGG